MFVLGIGVFVLFGLKIISCVPVTGVQLSETVLLTFSNITLEKWQDGGRSPVLKSTLADLTTSYCRIHSAGCGISSGDVSPTFLSTHVKFIGNYSKSGDNNDLKILLFIEIPPKSGENPRRISGTTLVTIFTTGKYQLSSDVGVNMTTVVSGSTLSSEEKGTIATRMNKIMIPLSFVLLLIIALVAWLLDRSYKKKQAKEQREIHKRYMGFLNPKKGQASFPEQITSQNNNSAEIPLTAFRQNGGGSRSPDQGNFEVEPDVPVEKRHRRRKKVRKSAAEKAPADESDDVSENEARKSDSDLPKRLKKSRRRRARKSSEREHAGKEMREQDGILRDNMIGERERGYEDEGNKEVNCGYQRDSENGDDADSAVELSSTAASSAKQSSRPSDLAPVSQTVKQDDI